MDSPFARDRVFTPDEQKHLINMGGLLAVLHAGAYADSENPGCHNFRLAHFGWDKDFECHICGPERQVVVWATREPEGAR